MNGDVDRLRRPLTRRPQGVTPRRTVNLVDLEGKKFTTKVLGKPAVILFGSRSFVLGPGGAYFEKETVTVTVIDRVL